MKTKIPNIFIQVIRYLFKFRVTSFYSLEDMANDINDLTIKLNISNYHVIGVSMGGMIAQLLAIKHTYKINSLISIMSTTGDPSLPKPRWKIVKFILSGSKQKDISNASSFYIKLWRLIGSPAYPRTHEEISLFVDRILSGGVSKRGTIRQMLAIMSSYDRSVALEKINTPTLVIHGTEDLLVPYECGIDTANSIKNSKLWTIKGMGHDFPYELFDEFVSRIDSHIKSSNKSEFEPV
tara:strand:+ start:1 stop:711 length:711 start_codon:yes stop_codon:yes gene_type:complete